MDLLLETIQLLAFAKVSDEILEEININKEEALELMSILSEEDLQLLYQIGLIAKRDMELAPSLSGGFDMALLRMVSFIPNQPEQSKKKAKSSTEVNKDTELSEEVIKGEDAKQAKLEDANNKEDNDAEKIILEISSDNWKEIFDQLVIEPGTKQLASHCYFIKVDETVIYLSMPEEKLNLFSGKHRKQLQDALSSFFGSPCNLFLEVGDSSEESPNKIKEEEKKEELRNAQKEIEDDPNVKSLVEAFGARVIESSIEPRTEK